MSNLGDALAQRIHQQLVREVPLRDEEPLPAGRGDLEGAQMRQRDVAHVDERPEQVRRHGVGGLTLRRHESVDVGGRGVQLSQTGCCVGVGPVDHGREDGRDVEAGPDGLDEAPGCALREGFRGEVGPGVWGVVGGCDFVGVQVPVCFGVDVAWPAALGEVEHSREGGGDDEAGDLRRVSVQRVQDVERPIDGWVKQIALVILDVGNLQRRRGVDGPVDALHGAVERAWPAHVFDNGEAQLLGVLREALAHCLGGAGGAHGSSNLVAGAKKVGYDVGGYEAGGAGDEDDFAFFG